MSGVGLLPAKESLPPLAKVTGMSSSDNSKNERLGAHGPIEEVKAVKRCTFAKVMCLVTMLVCCAGLTWADATAREVEEDNSLASSLVTPHKEWGRGYVGGPVRALFFVYTGPYDGTWEDTGTRVREVVELRERYDLRTDGVLFCGPDPGAKWHFHGGKLGEERAERLLEKPYQLYVIAGFGMDKLPAKIQYLILKQVAAGAGLLCCGPGAGDYMTAKRRLQPTPAPLVEGLPAPLPLGPTGRSTWLLTMPCWPIRQLEHCCGAVHRPG